MTGRARPSLTTRLRAWHRTLRQYHEISGVGEITRRYFAMNGFDGVLTTLGVLVGAYLGGVDEARAVVVLVVTTAVAMGVSGAYGSYMVESAERGRALRELEESTLTSLTDTTIGEASRYASVVVSAVTGGAPFLAGIVAVIPFAPDRLLVDRHGLLSRRRVGLRRAVPAGGVPRPRVEGAHLGLRAAARRRRSPRSRAQPGPGEGSRVTAPTPRPSAGLAERLLDGLNEPQRAAVMHGDGPLLVLAGAGSGKTRVLTHRVAHLIAAHGARPDEIVAITFTNKAAGEMKARIEGLVGGIARTMWISTFHSMCARILRREAQRLGYRSTFSIHDEDDRRRLLKRCLVDLDIDPKRVPPEAVARQISDAKNQLLDAAAYREKVARLPRRVGGRRLRALRARAGGHERHGLRRPADADGRAARPLPRAPASLPAGLPLHPRRRVPGHEPRPVPAGQLLAEEHRNLMVVGDDDQSIYSWRGADIRNILEFERDYPEATVIRLEQNYRSTQRILDVANAVVTHNRKRKGKHLWTPRGEGAPVRVVEVNDERAEAQFVASEVQKLLEGDAGERAYAPHEVAVLYRTNAQSRVLEEQCGRYAIGYQVIGGPKFYERAEIRDVLGLSHRPREPGRRAAPAAHRQRAAPGARGDDAAAPAGVRRRRRREPVGDHGPPPTCPGSRRGRSRRSTASRPSCAGCRPGSGAARSPRSCAACSTRPATRRCCASSAPSRPRAVSRTSRSSWGSRPSTTSVRPSPRSTASCRRSRSTPTSTRTPTRESSSR